MPDRRTLLVALVLAAAAAAGGLLVWRARTPAPEAVYAARVIALYTEERIVGSTESVHVADVSLDGQGNAELLRSSEPEVADSVGKALAELRSRSSLAALSEAPAGSGDAAFGLQGAYVRPGDPRYPWAVGAFLRLRTGLRYEVLGSGSESAKP